MPKTKIEIEKIFIRDAFSKWFKTPNYQRPYIWGEDQIVELLDDIAFAAKSDNFFTVVYCSILQYIKYLSIQQFVPKFPIERFDVSILLRLTPETVPSLLLSVC